MAKITIDVEDQDMQHLSDITDDTWTKFFELIASTRGRGAYPMLRIWDTIQDDVNSMYHLESAYDENGKALT